MEKSPAPTPSSSNSTTNTNVGGENASPQIIDGEVSPPWQREAKYQRRSTRRQPSKRGNSLNLDVRMLGTEILDYLDWIEPTVQEKSDRHCLCARLTEMVAGLWPDAKVRVYGSSSSYLMVPGSDIDFVIENLDAKKEEAMTRLDQELHEANMEHVVMVPATKVPVIRFIDPRSGLSCDISFCTQNAVRSTTVLRQFLEDYPCARPIVLVLKTLLRQNSLSTVMSGGLGSYGLALTVVSFLRIHEQDRLRSRAGKDRESSDYSTPTPANVGALFLEFLAYFSSPNATRYVYCAGGKEPQVTKTGKWFVQDHPYLLSVEDPLNPENDVTRGAINFPYIQSLFGYCIQGIQHYSNHPEAAPSMLSTIINPADPVFLSMCEKRANCISLAEDAGNRSEGSSSTEPRPETAASTPPSTDSESLEA